MSRRPSDAAGSVLSFTFLDVLMCTMGSLLLLLVLFGVIMVKGTRLRREGEETKISLEMLAQPNAAHSPTAAPPESDPADLATAEDPAELTRKLEELRRKRAEAERHLRKAADARQQEEARVTHLEDHERRLEHDLAKLHLTLQALEAAEQKQTVDQEQADADAQRLKDLIRDTESQLDEMRKAGGPPKSYAIVPYKGANGTFRRPVFVECTAQAVTIQPEGIVLTVADFDGPLRSGNPLAAAIRAAHEELNSRAVAAGQADMPDPYPLLIVRPDGAGAYAAALDAISSWESDYGYEFVEADWKLAYPEPDPRLGQKMEHAVEQARERQALLARAAPRRYASRLGGGRGGAGAGGPSADGADGATFNDLAGGGDDRIGAHAAEGSLAGGNGAGDGGNSLRGGNRYGGGPPGGAGDGNFSDEFANDGGVAVAGATSEGAGSGLGGRGNGSGGPAVGDPGAAASQGAAANLATTATPNGAPGTQYSVPSTPYSAQGAPAGAQSTTSGGAGAPNAAQTAAGAQANGNAGSGSASGAAAGSMASSSGTGSSGSGASGNGGNAAGGSISAGEPGIQPMTMNNRRSAADSRGSNWANEAAARRAAPITRPVKIVVTRDQLAVLDGDSRSAAATITFQQPVDGVLDQLAAAVQQQVKDWGLAGAGMYWRPTLVVNMSPGAERQAARLAELLDDSGLDVRLPQTATAASQGAGRATR